MSYTSLTPVLTVIYRDTIVMVHDNVTLHQINGDTIRNFKGLPANLTITGDMSLGHNAADSQWVYAHFVATNSVMIEPGFKVGPGSSMKISVGNSGGFLPRRSAGRVADGRGAGRVMSKPNPSFAVKYHPESRTVQFSLHGYTESKVALGVFDVRGVRRKESRYSLPDGAALSGSLYVGDLPRGVYFLRASVLGGERLQQRFVKW